MGAIFAEVQEDEFPKEKRRFPFSKLVWLCASGGTSKAELQERVNALVQFNSEPEKGSVKILNFCNVVSEGVATKYGNILAWSTPRFSSILGRQQIGRVCRVFGRRPPATATTAMIAAATTTNR